MSHLANYVIDNATRGASFDESAVSTGSPPATADMIFFGVQLGPHASAGALRELIASHRGEWAQVDLFDGQEHSYLEIGAWLGDQGLALTLMGMGHLLGMWQLLTPRSMLGSAIPDQLAKDMAGMGYVSIQSKSTTNSAQAVHTA